MTRLPVYQRILQELVRHGTTTVSSEQLAEMAHLNASKVRKDLSFLGSFGTRGSGYDTVFLLDHIDRELGLGRDWPVAIVGIGNLGRALANSPGFASRGFRVSALFDIDPDLVGTDVGTQRVRHIEDIEAVTRDDPPTIGVITTPAAAAQEVTDQLVGVGVQSLLNFAPRVLRVPPQVMLRYVDLSMELQVMTFYMSRRDLPVPGAPPAPLLQAVGVTSVER